VKVEGNPRGCYAIAFTCPGRPVAGYHYCKDHLSVESVVSDLRAEVRDLKARLKAARKGWMGMPCPTLSLRECSCSECVGLNATDLRVKSWRKP
jgi:hypothetical protein